MRRMSQFIALDGVDAPLTSPLGDLVFNEVAGICAAPQDVLWLLGTELALGSAVPPFGHWLKPHRAAVI
jgi:hypothetical protein